MAAGAQVYLPPPSPVAPPARVAPVDLLASQVAAWAEERCRRTSEHSASLDGLQRDFRAWRGGAERVGVRGGAGRPGGAGVERERGGGDGAPLIGVLNCRSSMLWF